MMRYVIPVLEPGGDPDFPRLEIDVARCDVCGDTRLCLIGDSAAGEYGDVRICKDDIDASFRSALSSGVIRHIVKYGLPMCRFTTDVPGDWPVGHKFFINPPYGTQLPDDTCEECKREWLKVSHVPER